MRRYYREKDDVLYDRALRRYIKAATEKRIGDHYYLNQGTENERVIPVDEVEEKQ